MTTSPSEASGQASSPRQPVRDKVIVITGSSSGLGLETARQLAGQGGEIVMIVRDQAGGEHAHSQVADAAAGKSPVLLTADLSVQAAIRRVAQQVRDRYDHIDILINNAGAAFSESEIRVLRYLPTNLSTPEIANELHVSPNTVRTHVRHLYAKLGTHHRTEAVARARGLGLLAPSARRR